MFSPPGSARRVARKTQPRPRAERGAAEGEAQAQHIDVAAMHATSRAFTAREAVPPARESVAEQIVQYAGSDLLCYPAEGPEGLRARQAAAWEPLLERARDDLGIALEPSRGVLHRDQPSHALDAVRRHALSADDFTLSGVACGGPRFGSALLTLGLWRGWFGGEEAFALSRIDEAWQEAQWGVDEEAAERTSRLQAEARMLEAWFRGLEAGSVSPA